MQSPAATLRILKYAFLVSALLFVYIAFRLQPHPQHPVSPLIEIAITFAGLASVLGGFVLPGVLFRSARDKSAEEQVKRRMAGGIISLAYFEACILFGLVLHFLGARVLLVEILFLIGIAAELFWNPGEPPGANTGAFPQA